MEQGRAAASQEAEGQREEQGRAAGGAAAAAGGLAVQLPVLWLLQAISSFSASPGLQCWWAGGTGGVGLAGGVQMGDAQ